jgi:hypothetical protein
MSQLSFAHISEWCARLARILRRQEVLASVPAADRVSLAHELLDARQHVPPAARFSCFRSLFAVAIRVVH